MYLLIAIIAIFAIYIFAFKNKSEAKSPEELYQLGRKYSKGLGVKKDFKKAFTYYEKAANQGLAEAQSALGYMYSHGKGVHPNNTLALQWYKKAADQGLAKAQFNLGLMYQKGKGVLPDENIAYKWLKKAADQGHRKAQDNIEFFHKSSNLSYASDIREKIIKKTNLAVNKQQTEVNNNVTSYVLQDKYIKAQNSKLLFDQAVELKRKGQYQASLMLYKQAYNVFPDDPDVQSTMYAMAKIYLLIGDYEKACALFQDGLTMKLAQNRERTGKFYQKYVINFFTGDLSESNPEYVWFRNLTADYSIFIGLSHYLLENEGAELLSQYRYDFINHIQSVAGKPAAMPSREYLQTCYEHGWERVILIASEFKDSSLDHVQERKQEFLDILKTIG